MEREVSIKHIYYYILKRWKSILAAMVIFTILIVGYSYYKSIKGSEPIENNNVEVYEKNFTEEEKAVLNRAIASYKDYVSILESYSNNYVIKMDVNNVSKYTVQYYVDTHYTANYNIEVTNDYTSAVIDSIKNILSESVDGVISPDAFDYLISTSASAYTVTINLCASDRGQADILLNVMEGALEEYAKSLVNTIGTFDLIKLNESYVNGYDSSIVKAKTSINQIMDAAIKDKNNAENLLSDKQKYVYNNKINSHEDSEQTENNTKTIKFDKKKVLIGAVAGFIIMIVFYFLKYILSKSIRSVEEISSITDSYNFGIINNSKSFFDKKRFGTGSLSVDNMTDYIAHSIVTYCKDNNIQEIFVTGTNNLADDENIALLGNKVSKAGIKFTAGGSITENTKALSEAVESQSVLIVEKIETSDINQVIMENSLFKKNNINVIGNVAIY